MSLLIVGSLGKATGLKGEVFVQAYNLNSPHWVPGTDIYVLPLGTTPSSEAGIVDIDPVMQTCIRGVRIGAKGRLVLRLDAVGNRSAAEELRNCPVAISLDSLEEPTDDEFYYHEIIGWSVWDQDEKNLGTVVRAVETYMDLVEVQPLGGGETFFIPVVEERISNIDRSSRVLHVVLPEGLVP